MHGQWQWPGSMLSICQGHAIVKSYIQLNHSSETTFICIFSECIMYY